MRNIPPLVIVFIVFFFLADQVLPHLGISHFARSAGPQTEKLISLFFTKPQMLESFIAAVFSLAIFEAAYVAEILRSGITSIADHQHEAAAALGLSRWQSMRLIVLPQALYKVLPPLGGQFISLIKDSAIVSVISVQDLSYQGTQLMASTYMTIEVWTTVSLLYLVLTLTCSLLVSKLEKWSQRFSG
jgi:polar amino acid transport system permease protein